MNLKSGIKRIIGFIVRNGIYDKAGFKRALQNLKLKGQLAIKEIAKETEPKAPPEKAVYVVLVPKEVLGNIWEFNSVHGSLEEAKDRVEKALIVPNPSMSKHREHIHILNNIPDHTNWVYVSTSIVKGNVVTEEKCFATVIRRFVK